MSATKPATQPFFFDGEPVTGADLEVLELYSRKSGINLNSASEQMFRVSPEGLTRGQGNELFKMLFEAAIAKQQPVHAHRCVECGSTISCSKPHCAETEGECARCHDPIDRVGQYFFNRRWRPII